MPIKSVMNQTFKTFQPKNQDETSQEHLQEVITFIRETKEPILATADYAGSGKTYRYIKAYENEKDTTVFIAPTNKLCLEFKRKQYNTMTLFSFLGGQVRTMKKNFRGQATKKLNAFYKAMKVVIVDECFCMRLEDIQRIIYLYRQNPHWILRFSGDNAQLSPIAKGLQEEDVEKEMEFLEQNFMKICPYKIHYNLIQRFRNESNEIDYEAIEKFKMLKAEIDDLSYDWNFERINHIVRHFPTISFKDIRTKRNICYLNDTSRRLNTFLINVRGGGIKENSVLICKKKLLIPSEDGDDYTCIVNDEYIVKAILLSADGKAEGYELYEELEERTLTITNKQYVHYFMYSGALTNHGLQGSTIDISEGKVTILDLNVKRWDTQPMINRKWLYVALSRCKKPFEQIQICTDNLNFNPKNLQEKIDAHIEEDTAKFGRIGLKLDMSKYISVSDFHIKVHQQQYKCACCSMDLNFDYEDSTIADGRDTNQYSINRIHNKDKKGKDLPHYTSNINIVCLHCQCADNFEWRDEI